MLTKLCDAGYAVSLETSGALDVKHVDFRVSKVLDLKTPGSNEVHRNLYSNLQYLTPADQVKFVICNRTDYDWAKDLPDDTPKPANLPVEKEELLLNALKN